MKNLKGLIFASMIFASLLSTMVGQSRSHTCHVYVVDAARSRKAFEDFRQTGNADQDTRALAAGQKMFPEFHPVIGEEELTTKSYPFPRSDLVITASVYYTDESMASTKGADSMLVGIVVASEARKDAISAENNAVSEVTVKDGLDTVRAKQYIKVKGRLYLVGIECHCKDRVAP